MRSLRIVLVAALVLGIGVVAFLVTTGRGLSGVPAMAFAVGLVLVVGGGVFVFQRSLGNEMDQLVSRTNAALQGVAERAGLEYLEPPASAQRFGEVQGTADGVKVRISLRSITSEDQFTTVSFPRRTLPPAAAKEVRPLVEDLVIDESGTALYLGQTPSWLSSIGWNPLPETDVDRVMLVLDRTRQLLRAAAPTVAASAESDVAVPPAPGHNR